MYLPLSGTLSVAEMELLNECFLPSRTRKSYPPAVERLHLEPVKITASLVAPVARISAALQTQLATTRNYLRRCNPSAMSTELTDMMTVA